MRATSRSHLLTLIGILAAACLAGTGCQYQMAWSVASPTAGTGWSAGSGAPSKPAQFGLLAPRPLRDEAAAPEGHSAPPAPEVAAAPRPSPAAPSPVPAATAAQPAPRPDDAPAIVWRASSRGVRAEPGEEVAPVKTVARHPPGPMHRDAAPVPRQNELPKELNKVTMPSYVIEPPDILLIDAFRVIPRPPYKIEPLDELVVQAPPAQVLPNEPIGGVYPVGPDGRVDLGFSYGKVAVAGLTPEQARAAISKHVADLHGIKTPAVSVALGRTRGFQQIRGEHLVRMDGTVSLGIYGEAYVAGMTLADAKRAIEAQLSQALLNPEVTVDVLAYNSKVYYVVYDGGGFGQQVFKLPLVGGETVLDALSELRGLPAASSTKRIWIARPVPGPVACRQILPVDWAAITEGAATNTNYQLFPGDRVYVKADHWVALENGVSKVLAPFERMFGFTLLGNATIRAVGGQRGSGTGGGF